MLSLSSAVRVFVASEPCDMRCSFTKLSALVKNVMENDSLSGHMFVFLSRTRTSVKILYWDRTGYAIWYKRLERGTFTKPLSEEIDYRDLMCMLEGIEIDKICKKMRYSLRKHDAHKVPV